MPRRKKTIMDIRSAARAHTRTALNTLAGIMRSKTAPAGAKATAAQAILDRGWGRPAQAVEMTVEDKRENDEAIKAVQELFAGAKLADEKDEPTRH